MAIQIIPELKKKSQAFALFLFKSFLKTEWDENNYLCNAKFNKRASFFCRLNRDVDKYVNI